MSKGTKKYSLILFDKVVYLIIARPRTTWWDNDWSPKGKHLRVRSEKLLAFSRKYYRDERIYAYSLTIGRFAIGIGPF